MFARRFAAAISSHHVVNVEWLCTSAANCAGVKRDAAGGWWRFDCVATQWMCNAAHNAALLANEQQLHKDFFAGGG